MNGCVYQTADKQCMKFTDKVRNTMSWCVGNNPCEFRKPSNADRIRAMSDEELAETFDLLTRTKPDSKDDKQSWLEWLKKERAE